MRKMAIAALLALAVLSLSSGPSPAAAAACMFHAGFKTLHDLIPEIVGACTADEAHNPSNGDALQRTTKGLLVWRKADNWTAFTDGSTTWLIGACGLESRPNDAVLPVEDPDVWVPGSSCDPPTERFQREAVGDWHFHVFVLSIRPDGTAVARYRDSGPCCTSATATIQFTSMHTVWLLGEVLTVSAPGVFEAGDTLHLSVPPSGKGELYRGDADGENSEYLVTLCGPHGAWQPGECGA